MCPRSAAQDAIAEMPPADADLATRIHSIVADAAPSLTPKTWYGQPAYANADGTVIVFFQSAAKFGTRYATLGFSEDSTLDEGEMWATSFALVTMTPAAEKTIRELIARAVS